MSGIKRFGRNQGLVLYTDYLSLEAANDKLDGLNAALDLENKALKAELDEKKTEQVSQVQTPASLTYKKPSCFGKKLGVEACNHRCPVAEKCYE